MHPPHSDLQAPVHAAKQEITETAKFLSWLWKTHHRNIAQCTQRDVAAWLAGGPTSRSGIRTFIVFAKKTRLNSELEVAHRLHKSSPCLTQDQRLAWLNELLTGNSESLPYRVAGILLLLYAQPLVRVAALPVSAVTNEHGVRITLGKHPAPVPEPFATLISEYTNRRPNQGPARVNTCTPTR